MGRKPISVYVERKLYAESMGRCMNPSCQIDLLVENGDIIEKAHIDSYYDSQNNDFENLVVLCPNCHTRFDKNNNFTKETVRMWKKNRREEMDNFFRKKFETFNDLKNKIVPLLNENKTIYEKYYLAENKTLWDKFQLKIIINNQKIKELLKDNLNLFQSHKSKEYSNLNCIQNYLLHIEEFESTRLDQEKLRTVLFPVEVNSIFGIAPIKDSFLPMTEYFEDLIRKLHAEGKDITLILGIDNPYFIIKNSSNERVFFGDVPRLRQLLYDYKCFGSYSVRFESLNFALKYLNNNHVNFSFVSDDNFRHIKINDMEIIFVYEYCLSKICLQKLAPQEGIIIVNLHGWNGDSCISSDAHKLAEEMNVKLLGLRQFYEFVKEIKNL